MTQTAKTYGIGELSVIVGGFLMEGIENISVEFPNDKASSFIDGSGNITRILNAGHKYCEVTIALSQTSESNLEMQNLYDTDAIIPVIVKDQNGNSQFTVGEAFFMARPNSEFSKEDQNNREWKLVGIAEIAIEGGN